MASASLGEGFVAVAAFCCGTLGFSRLSHGQRSWVRIPDPAPDPAVPGGFSLGWARPAHLLQLWELCKHTLLHCLKSELAAKAIIINPWEEMQSF